MWSLGDRAKINPKVSCGYCTYSMEFVCNENASKELIGFWCLANWDLSGELLTP